MDPKIYLWLKAAHLIALFLWIGGLFAIYWMLRLHVHAPKDAREKLTLMERSIALSADIAATIAIVTGLGMALAHSGTHPTTTLFTAPGSGWFHIKLTIVVLGILPVHGMLRAKIKKFGQGNITPVPSWLWSLFLVALTVIVILAIRGPLMFAK
jgi:putative membrane protein